MSLSPVLSEADAIAHEVKQPLTSIISNGMFSLRQIESASPNMTEIREAVLDIVNDARRAISIISQIRALALRDSSEQVHLDLNGVIRDVIAFLREPIERSRVSITLDLQEELPFVQGNPVQLQQAFVNILMNSVEAMQSSPEQDRKIFITSRAVNEGTLAEIRDSGPGFDPEMTEQLFEPRYTTKPEGMGLGLPLSRSIMELHGGHLTARLLSEGASFEFRFPVRAADRR